MVGQLCCGAFTVGTSDCNNSAFTFIPETKFNLTAYIYACSANCLHNRSPFRDAWAFHYTISGENTLLSVPTFFIGNTCILQNCAINILHLPTVTHKYIPPLLLAEQSCSYAAFCGAKDDQMFRSI